jgi:ABC-type glycerol-3-phosphate transport system substrate-binding protein
MGARPLHVDSLRRKLLAFTAAGALALAGCGGGIDSGQVEDEIAKDIEAETGVRVASVECPDEIEKKEGLTVQCTARGRNGGEAIVDVTQVDDDGSVQFRTRDLSPLAP